MLIPDLFKQIQVSPKVSFWVSALALSLVLLNNHVYLASIQQREKEASMLMKRNIEEADALSRKERLLRSWELQLISREGEMRKMIETATERLRARK